MKTRMEEICSSYEGKVEEIFVNESSYVYEWEKLMMIRKNNGELEKGCSRHQWKYKISKCSCWAANSYRYIIS